MVLLDSSGIFVCNFRLVKTIWSNWCGKIFCLSYNMLGYQGVVKTVWRPNLRVSTLVKATSLGLPHFGIELCILSTEKLNVKTIVFTHFKINIPGT